ncbi:unnamed protein product, partial [Rotaria sp. Silwood1]
SELRSDVLLANRLDTTLDNAPIKLCRDVEFCKPVG